MKFCYKSGALRCGVFILLELFCSLGLSAVEPLKDSSDVYLRSVKNLNSGEQRRYIDGKGKQLRNVIYKKVGGAPLFLDFYFPNEDLKQNKSVIIFTHGGGWAAGSKHRAASGAFGRVHRELLAKGFCIASIGYRLVAKGGDTTIRDCVVDVKDAVRFLSAHKEALGIESTRFFSFGGSAGGHLAQMALLTPSESLVGDRELAKYSYRVAAGVSWYGPCDFENDQLFNHDGRVDFRDRFGQRILPKGGVREGEKQIRYQEMSPVFYLNKNSPPLLMIQGDQDTTIPVKHALYMQDKANQLGADVEVMIIENAGHNWRRSGGNIRPGIDRICKKTVQFFVDHSHVSHTQR